MATHTTARRRTRPKAGRPGVVWMIAAAGVLLLAAAALWLKLPRGGDDQSAIAAIEAAKVLGSPSAPVEVEEWSDFQ